MSQLGYSYPRFKQIDDFIGSGNWNRSHDPGKTERYGKKYSWIAYFELYGLREDRHQLRERHRRFERTSDCDIDPSFPEDPASWNPSLPDVFNRSPNKAIEWLRSGPVPHYDHLLQRSYVDGIRGPWVLLNGFLEQEAANDPRTVFTFLRGLLIPESRMDSLQQKLESTQYPGNNAIPPSYEDYYTFAGEIPWSANFGGGLRTRRGKALRNLQSAFEHWDGHRRRLGFPVEIPVHEFRWESYHSAMNQTGGFETAAPALSEVLGLVNRARRSELSDSDGRQATVYRKIGNARIGHVLYMRRSVLKRYLHATSPEPCLDLLGGTEFQRRFRRSRPGRLAACVVRILLHPQETRWPELSCLRGPRTNGKLSWCDGVAHSVAHSLPTESQKAQYCPA